MAYKSEKINILDYLSKGPRISTPSKPEWKKIDLKSFGKGR